MQETPCPRCNTPQKFGLQKEFHSPDELEIFIRCTTCRYKLVVIKDHPDRIRNRQELAKLKIRALADPQLYKMVDRKIKRLRENE
jgi:hypothetical protein